MTRGETFISGLHQQAAQQIFQKPKTSTKILLIGHCHKGMKRNCCSNLYPFCPSRSYHFHIGIKYRLLEYFQNING